LNQALIIGCGDIGRRVAKLAMAEGAIVSAIVRSPEKAETLRQMGIRTVPANLDDPASLRHLPVNDAIVFYLAPPPGGGLTDLRMRAFCSTIHSGNRPAKAIYVSTSGVYGDCGDIPVTEETPVNPGTTRARRRLDAETALRECGERHNFPVIVLRVTGIYGPDRLPLRHLADGQPVLNDREAPFTNRIHADDLARVCMAAAAKGEAGDIFNVSDGQTTTITEYFNAVADSLGQPRPRQVTMSDARHVMSPLMLSYVSESRRMDNRRMLEKLGVALLYPTLEAGLKKLS
jgi:nucleoside-diphosphate-sugar epimerase